MNFKQHANQSAVEYAYAFAQKPYAGGQSIISNVLKERLLKELDSISDKSFGVIGLKPS